LKRHEADYDPDATMYKSAVLADIAFVETVIEELSDVPLCPRRAIFHDNCRRCNYFRYAAASGKARFISRNCLIAHPPSQPIRAIVLHARNYRLAQPDLTITALKAYSVLLLLQVVTLFLQNVDHPPKP
jgi:hypothetical protein